MAKAKVANMRVLTAELDSYQLNDILEVLHAKWNESYQIVKQIKRDVRRYERMMKEIEQVRRALLR